MAKKRRKGRSKGSRNKGYFYRKARGWCASDKTPLLDADGEPLRDEDIDEETVREAHARYLLRRNQPELANKGDDTTVIQVCQLYLDYCKANSAESTYEGRVGILFDFCTGLPAGLRNKDRSQKEREAVRIHRGYGNLRVSELIPLHVDQWLAAHPTWNGSKRTKIQAVKRALNYCVAAGLPFQNHIKGYKAGKANVRKTYITPEQEEACYKYASKPLATAIKVCIRTGARYGCEFAKLTKRHVEFTEHGMIWRFAAEESKTGRERIIRITAHEIIDIVQCQIKEHARGPIFRNMKGTPWRQEYLGAAFNRLKKKLAKNGIHLDGGACMYSCRHTYAKRALQGYWSGQPTNIETLALLMGNSREVCWEHYTEWCDTYTEPLWKSA
jgi:integrase